jgi:hypothetical protein
MAKAKRRTRSPKKTHMGRDRGRPVTHDYIRDIAGLARTKGKLLKALIAEKAKEREL